MYLETTNQGIATAEFEENQDVGSFNHGYIQLRLGGLLDRQGQFTPDIALYSKRSLSRPTDIQRMNEYPLVAIEILSPRQGFDEILERFKAYFALGVRSCWLVARPSMLSRFIAPLRNGQRLSRAI